MFNLKPQEVTFERIEAFCKGQNPEGETIEYKGDFPSNLEKSISAMANTYGGIILIGVTGDKQTNTPKTPIQGIELKEGLEERVTSICLRTIHPPCFPWVKVCPFKNDREEDRCVVFIRVYESDQTPHAINNNTDVYFRIRSQSEPFRKATVDDIEWLKNRRQGSVENRERLLKVAGQRFDSMPFDSVDKVMLRMTHRDLHSSYRKASIMPLFPSRLLLAHSDLLDLRSTFHDLEDQVFILDKPLSCSDSLCFARMDTDGSGNPNYLNYTEFNRYGLVYNKQSQIENRDPQTKELFDVPYLLKQVHRVITAGRTIYRNSGFSGSALIEVQVGGVLGKQVGVVDTRSKKIRDVWCTNKIESTINITKICSFPELVEELDTLLVEICLEFLWCCGAGERIGELEGRLRHLARETTEVSSSLAGVS
jgi:hypothetical protein